MRGRNNKRRETAKHGRRLVLAGLIVASGQFTQAETPVAMVPLPLTPLENEQAGVRSNPFCQPVIVEAPATKSRYFPEPVVVAPLHGVAGAGKVERNQWLQGVQAEAGDVVLTSGGEGLRSYLQGPPVDVAGGVRANPLASRFDVAEPKVDAAGVRALGASAERTSGVSFSLSDDDSAADQRIQQASEEPIELSFSDDSAVNADGDGTAGPGDDSGLIRTRLATRPATPWRGTGVERAADGLPEPVNLRTLEPRQFASGRILQVPLPEELESSADEKVADLQPLELLATPFDESRIVNGGRPRVEVGRPPVAVDRLTAMSIVPGKPRVLAVDQEDTVDGETGESIQGIDVQRAIAVDNSVAIPSPVAATAKTLQSIMVSSEQPTQAPVAASVAVPGPLNQGKPTLASSGTPSPASQPTAAAASGATDVQETIVSRFVLKPTEVRAITIDSPVARVQSDNMAVCAALKAPSGQVHVIATGEGTTRLSVHTVGKDGVEKIDRYEVSVGEVRASSVNSPESIAMTLTQTVQSAFPGANVLVSAEAGRLVVTGSCTDEDSARRMLRMIRSACAIPVVDRVQVR